MSRPPPEIPVFSDSEGFRPRTAAVICLFAVVIGALASIAAGLMYEIRIGSRATGWLVAGGRTQTVGREEYGTPHAMEPSAFRVWADPPWGEIELHDDRQTAPRAPIPSWHPVTRAERVALETNSKQLIRDWRMTMLNGGREIAIGLIVYSLLVTTVLARLLLITPGYVGRTRLCGLRCPRCCYDLRATWESARCPECGCIYPLHAPRPLRRASEH